MRISKKSIIVGLLSLFIFSFAVTPVLALDLDQGNLETVRTEAEYSESDLVETVGRIIKIVLGFLGLITLILIIVGGFQWMTSGGDEEKIGSAKKLISAAVVGLFIIIIAYALTDFVIEKLSEAAGEECTVGEYKCVDDGAGNINSTKIVICGSAEKWSETTTDCQTMSAPENFCKIGKTGAINEVCDKAAADTQ